jgi:hypothetical protein
MIVPLVGLLVFFSSGALAFDGKNADAYKFNMTHPLFEEHDKLLNGWVSYKQCDPTWANQQLGYCSLTICEAGCAMR